MEDRILPLWKPEIEMIERMRLFLYERLIGQKEAIDDICNLFVARAVRTDDDRRPFMSVFLNGTSGVGKTLMFELIGEFLNNEPKVRKTGARIPVTKISLNGVFAFELVEMCSGLSSGAKNPGDSKRSKFETLYEDATEADPIFARQFIILDEFEKLGPSINWNEKIAFNSLSETMEEAIQTPKHPDGMTIDLSNTILVITANYFLNEVKDPRRSIGFSVPDDPSAAKEDEAPQNIDKEGIIEKMRRHFSISSFNRLDKVIIFNDLSSRGDMRKGFAEKEIQKMLDTIDRFYTVQGNPLPCVEQYGNFGTLVQESLDNCEKSGGFRAIKRYVQNTILGRILSLLHKDYPNIPKEKRFERRICKGSGSQTHDRAPHNDDDFMEAFGMEDMAKELNQINYE